MSTVLSVEGLSKRYGAIDAVRGVSFSVGQGEIFGLIGPNGAGKTTTLECILGLTAPDAGAISVCGIDARANPAAAKDRLGAQLQHSSLPDAMSPRQALRLCAAFYRRPERPAALLERFQLQEKADARYVTLSGGQRQRLALALAFVNQPEVVVLDEPTVGLDPPARRELHALIRNQRAAGRTVVFTTHYLEEARQLCDRVGFIDGGRLIAVDTPEALVAASGALPRIHFTARDAVDSALVAAMPGVKAARPSEAGWTLETASLTLTLAALTARLAADRNELLDIHLDRPTLDDAFVKLAGRE